MSVSVPTPGIRRGAHPAGGSVSRALVALVVVLAAGVYAQTPAPDDAAGWILRLGAPTHAEREAAAAAVWRIGDDAREALQAAARDPDPEIALRARQVLADITDGIRPEWPEALQRRMREYDRLPAEQRSALLDALIRDRPEDAAPYLLNRVRRDEAGGGPAADRLIALTDTPRIRQWLLERIQTPRHEQEARVLAAACEKEGRPADLARALGAAHLPDPQRNQLVQTALALLQARVDAKEYEALAQDAAALAAAVPNEARFLYYEAAGAAHLNDPDRAQALCEKALALHPEAEAPHFAAGELLNRLNQPQLAAREWKRILAIPPENSIYDLNAHFRLGAYHQQQNNFAQAAEAYEQGLNGYRLQKERGGGVAMLGGSEEELVGRIAHLRERAERKAVAEAAWDVNLSAHAKNGQDKELAELRALADVSMTLKVQPYGFRLFEVAPATVGYDRQRKEFVVLLNDAPVAQGVPGTLKDGVTRVGVSTLDMHYLFEIDGKTGVAEKRTAIELDYVLRLEPPAEIRAWKDPEITLNGTAHTWEDLQQGVPFDILPEQITVRVRATAPDGEGMDIQATLDPAALIGTTKERP